MVPVSYLVTPGLHLTDFPAKLQIVRENKSKKAISDTFFKRFDIHSCICFQVCMLCNSQPLGRSCLELNASSTWEMLANAMRNWPLDAQHPVSLASIISRHHHSELCAPCLDYTAIHLHTHAQCRVSSPALSSWKTHSSDLVWVTFLVSSQSVKGLVCLLFKWLAG